MNNTRPMQKMHHHFRRRRTFSWFQSGVPLAAATDPTLEALDIPDEVANRPPVVGTGKDDDAATGTTGVADIPGAAAGGPNRSTGDPPTLWYAAAGGRIGLDECTLVLGLVGLRELVACASGAVVTVCDDAAWCDVLGRDWDWLWLCSYDGGGSKPVSRWEGPARLSCHCGSRAVVVASDGMANSANFPDALTAPDCDLTTALFCNAADDDGPSPLVAPVAGWLCGW
jgi:hypothetical protein